MKKMISLMEVSSMRRMKKTVKGKHWKEPSRLTFHPAMIQSEKQMEEITMNTKFRITECSIVYYTTYHVV